MGLYGSPEQPIPTSHPVNSNNCFIFCSACGFQYSKKIKVCPKCGKKHAQPFYNKWWFWLFVLLAIFAFFPSGEKNTSFTSNDNQNEIHVANIEEYKLSCHSIEYKDVARNPNEHKGKNVVFTGKVVQVQEDGMNLTIRINVTQGEYGIWEDTIYVDYTKKNDKESRILEDDIVTIYGMLNGIKNYQAVLGNQISIPHLLAQHIEIN